MGLTPAQLERLKEREAKVEAAAAAPASPLREREHACHLVEAAAAGLADDDQPSQPAADAVSAVVRSLSQTLGLTPAQLERIKELAEREAKVVAAAPEASRPREVVEEEGEQQQEEKEEDVRIIGLLPPKPSTDETGSSKDNPVVLGDSDDVDDVPKETDPMYKVVLQYPAGPASVDTVTITRGDLDRLREKMYLNDNLVDFYLKVTTTDDARSQLLRDLGQGSEALKN